MSSPSNAAANQAAANNAAEKASIDQATSQIGSIFDSPERQQQYSDLGKATTDYYTDQLNTQKTANDLQQKFSLARGGQTGGSLATDEATASGKDYLSGLLRAQGLGSAASASLQQSDAQERANLTAAAQGGLSATDAASQASLAMKGNLDAANASSTANAFGETFGDMSTIYQKSQDAAALRNGMRYSYNTLYQPGFGYGGNTGNATGAQQ